MSFKVTNPKSMSKRQRKALLLENLNWTEATKTYLVEKQSTRINEFQALAFGMVAGKETFDLVLLNHLLVGVEMERKFRI